MIMNIEGTEREVARRLIDFASGLCYALDGSMEKVATGVYLLKPISSRSAPRRVRRLSRERRVVATTDHTDRTNVRPMEMSPQQVRNASFKSAKRGYDPDEVQAFLRDVAESLEAAQNQSTAMEARARAAVARLQEVEHGARDRPPSRSSVRRRRDDQPDAGARPAHRRRDGRPRPRPRPSASSPPPTTRPPPPSTRRARCRHAARGGRSRGPPGLRGRAQGGPERGRGARRPARLPRVATSTSSSTSSSTSAIGCARRRRAARRSPSACRRARRRAPAAAVGVRRSPAPPLELAFAGPSRRPTPRRARHERCRRHAPTRPRAIARRPSTCRRRRVSASDVPDDDRRRRRHRVRARTSAGGERAGRSPRPWARRARRRAAIPLRARRNPPLRVDVESVGSVAGQRWLPARYPDVEPQPDLPAIERAVLDRWARRRHVRGVGRAAPGRRERQQRVRVLRRPAVRQRPAALRAPADRLRQGRRAALPDDARATRRAPLRVGLPRPARRGRSREGARHLRPPGDHRVRHRPVQRRLPHERAAVHAASGSATSPARRAGSTSTTTTRPSTSTTWRASCGRSRRCGTRVSIYEGFRVLAYCWRCETPLSNTETRMDDVYRDRQDPALTVWFELESGDRDARRGRPRRGRCRRTWRSPSGPTSTTP